MGVGDGHGQGVGRVGGRAAGRGQQPRDHEGDLSLVRGPGADDRLLDHLGRVFGHRQAGAGGGDHGRGPGVAQFQRGRSIGGGEGFLHRGFMWAVLCDNGCYPLEQT